MNTIIKLDNKQKKELRAKNWAKFAQGYNGSQFAANKYDLKLANAYAKHK